MVYVNMNLCFPCKRKYKENITGICPFEMTKDEAEEELEGRRQEGGRGGEEEKKGKEKMLLGRVKFAKDGVYLHVRT